MTRTPRPYQAKNISEIIGHLSAGAHPLYQCPTGGGKTLSAGEVIRWWLGAMPGDVCFAVHRQELLRQASASLAEQGIEHGIIDPNHGEPTSHRVHVAMQPTMQARATSLAHYKRRLGLIIPDEAHHSVSAGWLAFLQSLKAQRLGLSATPWRLDGKALGGHYNTVVRAPSTRQLTADGYLARARTYAPPMPKSAFDASGVTVRAGDLARDQLAVVTNTTEFFKRVVHYYQKYLAGEPAIVSCVNVEGSQMAAEALCRAGWKAQAVWGAMDQELGRGARKRAFDGLADGSVHVLTFCDLIDEGVDVPVVRGVIKGRKTQSTGKELQIVGRTLRPVYARGYDDTREGRLAAQEAGDKPFALIIDLVKNVGFHGMHDAERKWSLEAGIRGLERAVPPTIRCRRCYLVEEDIGQRTCAACGHIHVRRAAIISSTVNTDLLTVGGANAETIRMLSARDAARLAKTEDEMKKIALIKGYKPGWAYFQWKERQKYSRSAQQRVGTGRLFG